MHAYIEAVTGAEVETVADSSSEKQWGTVTVTVAVEGHSPGLGAGWGAGGLPPQL